MAPVKKTVNLRDVAAKVGLAPCSVSAVLNDTEAARAIPRETKDRIFRAAAELEYRPNLLARSLRTKRTRMVAIIAPNLGRSAVALVVTAAQQRLHQSGYLLVLGTSDEGSDLSIQFQQRGIEGIISIDAAIPAQIHIPVTCIELAREMSVAPLTEQGQTCLPELGEAAAETIMRQIETAGSSPRVKIRGTTPAYFDLERIDIGFSVTESA